jgi:hypothetical protein
MLRLKTTCGIFFLFILAFSFSINAEAQADCVYGLKIYARDEAGKAIENGKLEVVPVGSRAALPPYASHYVERGGLYNIAGHAGKTIRGDFLFRISAEGFDSYERKFNYPVCELQSFELRLPAKGSPAKALFERLLTVHGKVYDEDKKPLGNAKIEATGAGGRIYQAASNAYGYFELHVPGGAVDIRVSHAKFPDVVFDNYKVEKNYSVLNVPVCLKCSRTQSQN